MSVLYALRYAGKTGIGVAAICIGGGTIVGFDGADGRYRGTYRVVNGRLQGEMTLTMAGVWPMVTGERSAAGQKLDITLDLPAEFGDGSPQQVSVGGHPVTITAQKVGEVP